MKTAFNIRLPHHFGKYALVSALSTTVDFSTFFALGKLTDWQISNAAFFGAALGGLVSWSLNQFWVFSHTKGKKRRTAFRYLVGIALAIFLNGTATGFFCGTLNIQPMIGRVAAALSTWFLIYWFNRKVVFHV